MPSPNAVSASNVNIELGVSSSTQLKWGNNWVRNVTTQFTGTNSTVNGSKMRWGINFPGGNMLKDQFNSGYSAQYSLDSTLIFDTTEIVFYDGVTYAEAYSEITFYANGVMRLQGATAGAGPTNYHKTWLTSGAAGDYTVQFQHTAGDPLTTGTSNTDFAMSTDRTFALLVQVGPGVDADSNTTFGNLIIKDSGGTLITRPIELNAFAEVV